MAGYSKTPLLRKLGIKPKMRVHLRRPPHDYQALLGELPEGVALSRSLRGSFDLIQAFYEVSTRMSSEFPRLKAAMNLEGCLWISWPKKASGVASDLDENHVRRVGLANGLVDIKVCAVDEIWSGLKFVYRKADRQ